MAGDGGDIDAVIHLHRHVAMVKIRGLPDARKLYQRGRDGHVIAENLETQIGRAFERDIGPGDNGRRAVISPHGVQRYRYILDHLIFASERYR